MKKLIEFVTNLLNEIVMSESNNECIDLYNKEKELEQKLIKQQHERFKRQWGKLN